MSLIVFMFKGEIYNFPSKTDKILIFEINQIVLNCKAL